MRLPLLPIGKKTVFRIPLNVIVSRKMLQWLAHFEFGATCLPQFAGSDGQQVCSSPTSAKQRPVAWHRFLWCQTHSQEGHGVFMVEFSGAKSG